MARDLNIKTPLMGKGLIISTVFLGEGYETVVFHRKTGADAWDRQKYETETLARKGHRDVVAVWKHTSRNEVRNMLKVKLESVAKSK